MRVECVIRLQEQGGTVGRSRKSVAADARHILSEAAVGLSAKDLASDSDAEEEAAPEARKRGRGGRDEFGGDAGEEGQWGMSFKDKMRAKKYKKKGVVVQDGSMYAPALPSRKSRDVCISQKFAGSRRPRQGAISPARITRLPSPTCRWTRAQ